MVGLMVEDEYTINVKIRRPVGEDGVVGEPLQPPIITITPKTPKITLTPPPNTAKRGGGSGPLVQATANRSRGVTRPQQMSIMPPPGTVREVECDLPLVQVFGADNTLLASNIFHQPNGPQSALVPAQANLYGPPYRPSTSPQPAQQTPAAPLAIMAPGALYVPRIKKHCSSESGVLYVPPVEQEKLRQRKQDQPPARGNSKRKKNALTGSAASLLRSPSAQASARALLNQVLSPRLTTPSDPTPPPRLALPSSDPSLPSPSSPGHLPHLRFNNVHLAPSHITAPFCSPPHPDAVRGSTLALTPYVQHPAPHTHTNSPKRSPSRTPTSPHPINTHKSLKSTHTPQSSYPTRTPSPPSSPTSPHPSSRPKAILPPPPIHRPSRSPLPSNIHTPIPGPLHAPIPDCLHNPIPGPLHAPMPTHDDYDDIYHDNSSRHAPIPGPLHAPMPTHDDYDDIYHDNSSRHAPIPGPLHAPMPTHDDYDDIYHDNSNRHAPIPGHLHAPMPTPSNNHQGHDHNSHHHPHSFYYHYEDSSGSDSSDSSDYSGERVVESYGGGGGGGGVPGAGDHNSRGSGGGHPQPIDPALLTSLDLEEEEDDDNDEPRHHNHNSRHHRDMMLVTSSNAAAHHHPQQSSYPHDFNHNDNGYGHKPSDEMDEVRGRALKYLVRGENDQDGSDQEGQDNYAYDHDLCPGLDNLGYDLGYSSERSPEDEEGPPLYYQRLEEETYSKLVPGQILDTRELSKLFPFINEATVFEVPVTKTLRGLGLAVCGGSECTDLPHPGLIRVKRLYPQTPAWLCGKLKVGDLLLSANTQPLTGLTSHEALEMLRIAEREVTLEVCRPPPGSLGGGEEGEGEDQGDGTGEVVSTSLTLPNYSHNYLSPSPSFSTCGEFEVVLTKVAGSLGFTLRKQDNSILGHTIRALVREPALSDGRLRPGDKIISVNATNMCTLTHQEAISFLRTCPETVTLRLYRDAMQTPVSPASPTEPDPTAKPKSLRKEARDMLSDLAMRKQSPASSLHMSDSSASLTAPSGSTSASPATPRRRRLHKTPSPDIKAVVADRWDTLVREADPHTTATTTDPLTSITESDLESTRESSPPPRTSRHPSSSSQASTPDSSRPKRPSFLDLSTGRACPRKSQFTPPHEVDRSFPPSPQPPVGLHHHHQQNQHPSSLPPLEQNSPVSPNPTSAHSDATPFSHLHPAYHSVNLGPNYHNHHNHHNHLDDPLTLTNTTSDQNLAGMGDEGTHGLRKWKGVVFTPDEDESGSSTEEEREQEGRDVVDRRNGSPRGSPKSQKRKLVTVDLNRGWNSRLGFSLGAGSEGEESDITVITAIYADSVAAKDGRLRAGDIVVQVNNVEVTGWDSESVIDLLRKTRGRISLSVLQ